MMYRVICYKDVINDKLLSKLLKELKRLSDKKLEQKLEQIIYEHWKECYQLNVEVSLQLYESNKDNTLGCMAKYFIHKDILNFVNDIIALEKLFKKELYHIPLKWLNSKILNEYISIVCNVKDIKYREFMETIKKRDKKLYLRILKV